METPIFAYMIAKFQSLISYLHHKKQSLKNDGTVMNWGCVDANGVCQVKRLSSSLNWAPTGKFCKFILLRYHFRHFITNNCSTFHKHFAPSINAPFVLTNTSLLQKNNVTTAKIIIFQNKHLKFSRHEKWQWQNKFNNDTVACGHTDASFRR